MDPFGADADDAFAVFDGKSGIKRDLEGGDAPTDPKKVKTSSVTDGLLDFGSSPAAIKPSESIGDKSKGQVELDEIAARERASRRKKEVEDENDTVLFGKASTHRLPVVQSDPDRPSCTHDIAVPEGHDWSYWSGDPEPPPAKPAKEYGFKLDPFQSESIRCLEKGILPLTLTLKL